MIAVENLCLRSGAFGLEGVSFRVPAGKYAILMGRTGCGKTSLLEAICGLKPVASGRIELAGRDVTRLPPSQRGVGYVPQDAALFSTMTVRRHLEFALSIRGRPADAVARRVAELADMLGIRHLLDRKPAGLSGGEARRVALGRALSFDPAVLLMDEPMSGLDDETRDEMYALLDAVRKRTPVTTLHVTHSRAEAARLGDVVFMLKDGLLQMTNDQAPMTRTTGN